MNEQEFLKDLDDIVYYSYLDEKYVDFQTIMYLIDRQKSFVWRLLVKIEMPFIEYNNRQLYKFEDMVESVELMELIDIEKLGL
jgi:hypothetical protein